MSQSKEIRDLKEFRFRGKKGKLVLNFCGRSNVARSGAHHDYLSTLQIFMVVV